MPSTTVVITGIRRIDKKLKLLPLKVQKKVVRQSMRKGMKIVLSEVKSEAPVDSGVLKSNLALRARKRKKRGTIELEVRIKANDETKKTSKAGKTVFYPAIVEYGHGNAPPNPFMRRAYTQSGRAARDETLQALLDGVNREVKALS